MPVDGGHRAQQLGEADVLVAVRVHGLPEQLDLLVAAAATSARAWRSTSRGGDPRSRPRVYGTTQKVQNLSQPRWMVT